MSVRLLLSPVLFFAMTSGVATAQVVQLPTFHQFSVSTTVVVPDRGSAALGGVGRSGSSRVSSGIGPLQNRAIASGTAAGGARVLATVHDLQAMDRDLLDQAAQLRGSGRNAADTRDWLARHGVGTSSAERPADGLAEIQRRRAALQSRRIAETEQDLKQARAAESEGKIALAKMYYRKAALRSGEDVRSAILAHVRSLDARR